MVITECYGDTDAERCLIPPNLLSSTRDGQKHLAVAELKFYAPMVRHEFLIFWNSNKVLNLGVDLLERVIGSMVFYELCALLLQQSYVEREISFHSFKNLFMLLTNLTSTFPSIPLPVHAPLSALLLYTAPPRPAPPHHPSPRPTFTSRSPSTPQRTAALSHSRSSETYELPTELVC